MFPSEFSCHLENRLRQEPTTQGHSKPESSSASLSIQDTRSDQSCLHYRPWAEDQGHILPPLPHAWQAHTEQLHAGRN